jgi:hypothetical protein
MNQSLEGFMNIKKDFCFEAQIEKIFFLTPQPNGWAKDLSVITI